MKKKGFTLVEMMVVVAIMAIIMLLVVPNVTGMLKKIDNEKYERFLSDVFLATEAYIQKNIEEFSDIKVPNQKVYVYYTDLISSNYLKSTTYDPKNKKQVKDEDYTVEVYLNDDNEYSYKVLEKRICNYRQSYTNLLSPLNVNLCDYKNMDDILANYELVESITLNVDSMNYLITDSELINEMKNSTNYDEKIVQYFLDSNIITNSQKYAAGLPCYIYLNGKSDIISNWSKYVGGYSQSANFLSDSIGLSAAGSDIYGNTCSHAYANANSPINITNYSKIKVNSILGYTSAIGYLNIQIGTAPVISYDNAFLVNKVAISDTNQFLDVSKYDGEYYLSLSHAWICGAGVYANSVTYKIWIY